MRSTEFVSRGRRGRGGDRHDLVARAIEPRVAGVVAELLVGGLRSRFGLPEGSSDRVVVLLNPFDSIEEFGEIRPVEGGV